MVVESFFFNRGVGETFFFLLGGKGRKVTNFVTFFVESGALSKFVPKIWNCKKQSVPLSMKPVGFRCVTALIQKFKPPLV